MPAASAEVELVPEDGSKALRRSRTGCLTCRRRKKKCPEEYEGSSCVRCKAGGWKCIPPAPRGPKSASKANRRRTSKAEQPREMDESPIGGLGGEGDGSDDMDIGVLHSLRSPSTGTGGMGELSEILAGNVEGGDTAMEPLVLQSASINPNIHQTASIGVTALFDGLGGMDLGAGGNLAPTQHTLADPSNSQQQQQSDSVDIWIRESLEALLSESMPPVDLSLYESMGQVASLPSTFPPTFSPSAIGDQESNPRISMSHWANPQTDFYSLGLELPVTVPEPSPKLTSADGSALEGLLFAFYDRYVAPAWTATYPPGTREAMYRRYQEVTNVHALCRACRKAVAAAYISLLQKRHNLWVANVSRRRLPTDAIPAQFLQTTIDAEDIIRQATLLARSPRDVNLTVEAHLWALSDLHMAVGSFCDASKGFAVLDMAEQLLSVTYGPRPDMDFESKAGHSSFCLRAFAMIDLNRSLCHRRQTFFNFDYEPTAEVMLAFHNDGTHDNWFGVPSGLLVILSRLSNYISKLSDNPDLPDRLAFATACESALTAWRPIFSLSDQGVCRHPREYAAEMAVEQELWRTMGLVLLDWLVFRRSLLEPRMRSSIKLMLSLLRSLPVLSAARLEGESPLIDFWSSLYATPAFLAGALLTDIDERLFVRRFLEDLGAEKALEDMLTVLGATWAATDMEGKVVDWFSELKQRGLSIIFF